VPAYIEAMPADRPTHMLGRPIERLVTHDGDLGDFIGVSPVGMDDLGMDDFIDVVPMGMGDFIDVVPRGMEGWRPDPRRHDVGRLVGMDGLGRKFSLGKDFRKVAKMAAGVGLIAASPFTGGASAVAGAALIASGAKDGGKRRGGPPTYLDDKTLEQTYLPPGAQAQPGPYAAYGPYGQAPYAYGPGAPPPEALYGPAGEPLQPGPVPPPYTDPYAQQAQAWGQTYGDPSGAGFDPYTQSATTQQGAYAADGGTLMDAPRGRGYDLAATLRRLGVAERQLVQADKDVLDRAVKAIERCRDGRQTCKARLAACKAGRDVALSDAAPASRVRAAALAARLRELASLDRALDQQERDVVRQAADRLAAIRRRLTRIREELRRCKAVAAGKA